jgi:hypothetical protein
MQQWYTDGQGIEKTEAATELLVCETAASTAGPPKINFPNEACGVWSTIGMTHSVRTNGFSAGVSIFNNTAYVGRGQQDAQFMTGRYQAEDTSTAYVAWAQDVAVDYGDEWLIVPQNCTCRWLTPTAALARKGLMTASDSTFNFIVGRKKFSNGEVAVTRVAYFNMVQWYDNENNIYISDYASELLVCENIPPPPNACGEFWLKF